MAKANSTTTQMGSSNTQEKPAKSVRGPRRKTPATSQMAQSAAMGNAGGSATDSSQMGTGQIHLITDWASI